ncbi:hypothetical protein DRQ29_02965 [bacterium]|nr:MAG: hypothetical protein DRQ29_02965 [bacterium]
MLENLVGARVIMTINNPKYQDRQLRPKVEILENETITISARVVETDELGVWIEHTDYPFPDPKTNRFTNEKAYLLIRYEYISSIAYFPELPADKSDTEHQIGFIDDFNR